MVFVSAAAAAAAGIYVSRFCKQWCQQQKQQQDWLIMFPGLILNQFAFMGTAPGAWPQQQLHCRL